MKESKKKNAQKEPELKAQVEDYTTQLKRLQAEFENYIKRVEKERTQFSKFATEKLCLKLLTVLDEFEQALKNIKDKDTKKGVQMIYHNLSKSLLEEGIKPIHAMHEKFDPYKHEVLSKVDGEKEDIVLEEIQKGYTMHDKVIRHAKVKISKGENKMNEELLMPGNCECGRTKAVGTDLKLDPGHPCPKCGQ